MTLRLLCCCLLLLVAVNAAAGPKEEVIAAMDKALAARSYHVTMRHGGAQPMTTEADFVAPDRLRMKMPVGVQTVIGDTMYMEIQGRSMKVQVAKGTMTQWRDPANQARYQATMTVKALGNDTVDGKPAKKYQTSNTQPQPSSAIMWIGADGYPLQIEVSGGKGKAATTTMRYSRYNDPTIRIDPP